MVFFVCVCLGRGRLFCLFLTHYHILFMSVHGSSRNHSISQIESSPSPCTISSLQSCRYKNWDDNLLPVIFSGYYTSIPGSCNFETQDQEWTTVCGLIQDSMDDFDWNVSKGGVSGQTGPDTDHTPGIAMCPTSPWRKWNIHWIPKKNHCPIN